ncbi:hypothetical protein [Leptolyngbya sp. PCC 6406]|uniref:hypothetical protein n=1 Tax=Leptolyngbya sp. PCC 6406 TaxID=1173264 RepID=UPI0002DAC359|nr:hypothetical protein [Leptolyngbya sp. PCC 6406]
MAFSTYKTMRSVVQDYEIVYQETDFIYERTLLVSDYFREDLLGLIRDGVVDNSEYAICENLIAPILKEVWKSYRDYFLLWSHETLRYDNVLNGVPDYILATRSPLGKIVMGLPYLLVVEAKQDKFDEGWSQCLAAMIAAQKLNQDDIKTVFGVVTNGEIWEFGKLTSNGFTKNRRVYLLQDLEGLLAAVNDVFFHCKAQLAG